jgi:5'-deoxynucleotidase YfbR-like HD superfamily hydrolase
MSDYITTNSKIHFTPLKPKKEQIVIEDIAHSLSLMTRANGHFPEFYSVAQHCIHCYEEAVARGYDKRLCLACLLHDASEAYLADITRPVKKNLPKYLVIEKILQDTIYERFLGSKLTEEQQQLVSEVDDALLYYEFEHYMGERLMDEAPMIKSKPVFAFVPFAEVEKKYIEFSQI